MQRRVAEPERVTTVSYLRDSAATALRCCRNEPLQLLDVAKCRSRKDSSYLSQPILALTFGFRALAEIGSSGCA